MEYPSDEAVVFAATTKQQTQMIERLQWQKRLLEKELQEATEAMRLRQVITSVIVSIVLLPATLLGMVVASSHKHTVRKLKRSLQIKNSTIRQMHIRLKELP